MRETAASRNVELVAELDMEIGKQVLDRTAIYRAILDLVTNAVDACAESESGKRVSVESHAAADEILVTVADNGIGISDEVWSNLFVRFFSTKGGQGTGLGLPVVKKVVEEHGGTVEVESKLGEGSAFHLRFPKSPALRFPSAKPERCARRLQQSAAGSYNGGGASRSTQWQSPTPRSPAGDTVPTIEASNEYGRGAPAT
jgi:nitrogen-specific signal transduction histidine kinase